MKSERIHYIDIQSMIKCGFVEKRLRYKANPEQFQYDKIAEEIFLRLVDIKLNNEFLNNVYEICFPDIYNSLSVYFSFVLDYESNLNRKIVYDRESSPTFHAIINKMHLNETRFESLRRSRLKKKLKLKIYHKLLRLIPSFFMKDIILSTTYLKRDLIGNKKLFLMDADYFYSEEIKFNKNLDGELNKVTEKVIIELLMVLGPIVKKSNMEYYLYEARCIIQRYMNRTRWHYNLLRKDRFISGVQGKHVLTASGVKYNTRLMCFFLSRHNKINRLSHGGDRCFFDDTSFKKFEFYKCDTYYTHGVAEGRYLFHNSKGLGSSKHNQLFNKFFEKKSSYADTVVYCSGSYVGDIRHFFNVKFVDTIYFDWQLYLVRLLKKHKYQVLYKKHPKGFFHAENIVGKFCDSELRTPMEMALEVGKTWIFDMAGSAFVEALCAGKDVIYIDMGQRRYNSETFNELSEVVKIIRTFNENGILGIDEDELNCAIHAPQKSLKAQKELVEKYYLSRSVQC